MSIGASDNLLIRPMTVEDYEEVNLFMRDNFYKDGPMSGYCGEDVQKSYAELIDKHHIAIIEEGLSLIVLEQNDDTERIVAMVLSGLEHADIIDINHTKALELPECALKHISVITSEAEIDANVFQRYNVSRCLHFYMYAVDRSMRGKGLGARLVAAQLELCRAKKFPLMVAYCSSYYSARQMEQMGMECVWEVAYSDYKDANGKVVFQPPAPHTHLRVMAIKL